MKDMILFVGLIITISVLYIVFMVYGSYILIKIGSFLTKQDEFKFTEKYFERMKYIK